MRLLGKYLSGLIPLFLLVLFITSVSGTQQQLMDGFYVDGKLNIFYNGSVESTEVSNVFGGGNKDNINPEKSEIVECLSKDIETVRLEIDADNHRVGDVRLNIVMSVWYKSNGDFEQITKEKEGNTITKHSDETIIVSAKLNNLETEGNDRLRVIISLTYYDVNDRDNTEETEVFYLHFENGGRPSYIEDEVGEEDDSLPESFSDRMIRVLTEYLDRLLGRS